MDYTHALDLLGGKETKLNLLDGAQRRFGEREENVRHFVCDRCKDTSGSEFGRSGANLGNEGSEVVKA